MARISFIPLTGHINPTLKLAKQLAQRGHQVSYLGLPDFEEHVRSQGLGFIPIFASLAPKGILKRLAEQRVNLYDVLFREMEPPKCELETSGTGARVVEGLLNGQGRTAPV